jgi:hypothetical protein
MLTRNYDRVQRYFPMRAISLAVAELAAEPTQGRRLVIVP